MIAAFITFLVLYGLISVLERDRDDLDGFVVASVAVIPVLATILVRIVLGLLYPDPLLLQLVPPLVLIGLTFVLLWKHLEIPLGRSIGYTVVVVAVNEVLAVLLA